MFPLLPIMLPKLNSYPIAKGIHLLISLLVYNQSTNMTFT